MSQNCFKCLIMQVFSQNIAHICLNLNLTHFYTTCFVTPVSTLISFRIRLCHVCFAVHYQNVPSISTNKIPLRLGILFAVEISDWITAAFSFFHPLYLLSSFRPWTSRHTESHRVGCLPCLVAEKQQGRLIVYIAMYN